MNDFIIKTKQHCKSFKDKQALRGVDLQVPTGSIFPSASSAAAAPARPPPSKRSWACC